VFSGYGWLNLTPFRVAGWVCLDCEPGLIVYDERSTVLVIVLGLLVRCFERLWLDAFAMITEWAMTYMGSGRLGVIYSVYFSIVPVWHISKA